MKMIKWIHILFGLGFLSMYADGDGGGGGAAPAAPAAAAGDPASPAAPAAPAATDPAATPAGDPAPIKNLFEDPADPAAVDPNKPADAPKPEDKPADAPAYELKTPEGLTLSDEQLSGVKAKLAAANVPPDQAQSLFDEWVGAVKSTQDATIRAMADNWQNTQREWQAQINADPDIGGAKLEASIADTRKGAETLLGNEQAKELFKALNITGAGNNPAIVKALHKAFSVHAPAKPVTGAPAGNAGKRSAGSILYPTQAGLGNAALNQ